MKLRRWVCFAVALALMISAVSSAGAEEEGERTMQNERLEAQEHFTPENPEQSPLDDGKASVSGGIGQDRAQGWYQDMLAASWMRLGNNQRLQRVVERARSGETITLATIGGSITEGAGATHYMDCYAWQVWKGFKGLCGTGSRVNFVNAGVGGTPSTFGLMRYDRDVVSRVKDTDGLPDVVIVEYAVNDGGEPTNHGCYESMVRRILEQPNQPAVILLFAVFPTGYNLQGELKAVGERYDLMMVSIKDGPFACVGEQWSSDAFFYDQYHPTTLGHTVMADCILGAMEASLAEPVTEVDIDLSVPPVYSDAYTGLRTIYREGDNSALQLSLGSFSSDDRGSYTNGPVGRVCGENFFHDGTVGNEPLTFTAAFRNLLIAYRATGDAAFGRAEVYVDGVLVRTLQGNTGSWGQSVVDLLYVSDRVEEHTVAIRMAPGDEQKKFTITCLGYTAE